MYDNEDADQRADHLIGQFSSPTMQLSIVLVVLIISSLVGVLVFLAVK